MNINIETSLLNAPKKKKKVKAGRFSFVLLAASMHRYLPKSNPLPPHSPTATDPSNRPQPASAHRHMAEPTMLSSSTLSPAPCTILCQLQHSPPLLEPASSPPLLFSRTKTGCLLLIALAEWGLLLLGPYKPTHLPNKHDSPGEPPGERVSSSKPTKHLPQKSN